MKRLLVLLLSLALLACVPTPEEEFVVNKGDEKEWQQAAEPENVGTGGTGGVPENENVFVSVAANDPELPTESKLYERLGAPKYWSTDMDVNGVRVVAEEAPVILPIVDRVPAAEAQPTAFSEQELNAAVDAFFGKRQIDWYDYGTYTKERIAELIRYWQDLLPTAEDEAHSEYWMQRIKELSEAYNRAPSESDLKPIPLAPTEYTVDSGGEYVRTMHGLLARAEIDGEQWVLELTQDYGNQILEIAIDGKQTDVSVFGRSSFGGNPVIDTPWGVTLSKGDAIAQGNAIVQAIDENYSLCFCGPAAARFADDYNVTRNWGWGLVYMREINGFPSAFASREIGDRMDDETNSIPSYERLFLVIDDQGPVYLHWQTPMEITRILGADQTLLSFDEAVSKGKNMIAAHWAYELERDPGSYVKIDKVKLGLCRIAKKSGGYYYVPAYYFYLDIVDTEEYRNKYNNGWENFYRDERAALERSNGVVKGDTNGYFREYNVVVINALDGTAIDLGKGY
jgi:hypothetical protein